MKDCIVISESGIEVYKSDIDILTSEYIESLPDESMIYKSPVFKGLLLYIYNTKLRNVIESIKNNKGINQYNIDYSLMDSIFNNVYLPLCYRFSIVPTVLSFSVFVGIDNSFLYEVNKGIYRNGSKVNPDNTRTVKKWYSVCESALADKAFNENSIGSIFGLKANYQWTETAPQTALPDSTPQATPEQIAERYRDAKKPELPVFETE